MTTGFDPQVDDIEIGDELIDPSGVPWTVVDTFDEPRFGMRVSITVQRGTDRNSREVIDAADEVRHDGERWRIHPNYQIGRHQGGV